MKTPRRFKLRNGIIVEEFVRSDTRTGANGYIDDYKIIDPNDVYDEVEELKAGEWICLAIYADEKYPKGGAWGPDFDIIEEV